MKIIRKLNAPFFILIVFFLALQSCKKDKTELEDFQSSAQDIGQMESIYTDIDNLVAEASSKDNFSGRYSNPLEADQFVINSCATITNDSLNGILTIDFGTACVGRDGRTRSGIIQINYSGGRYFDVGSTRTVSFINYYIDGLHVEGSRNIINNGFNSAGNMNWTITATNMMVTRPDGSWHSRSGQRNREMIAGYGDSLWVNDVYLINGTGSGTNNQGNGSTSILTNLVRDNSCHWIIRGTIELTPTSRPSRLIDFGNGTCDNLGTVTMNGNTRTIRLRP
jgi:hypothetical protein